MNRLLLLSLALMAPFVVAQQPASAPAAATAGAPHIAPGSKVFIEPMDGFEKYLAAALLKKKVPVMVVMDKAAADFVISGTASSEKAGWAKTIFVSPASHASASISVVDAHTGALAYAYNVDKMNAARNQQSTAEACAKHLKQAIEDK